MLSDAIIRELYLNEDRYIPFLISIVLLITFKTVIFVYYFTDSVNKNSKTPKIYILKETYI